VVDWRLYHALDPVVRRNPARDRHRGKPSNSTLRAFYPVELIMFQMISSAEDPMQKKGDQIVETAVEARAGVLGRPVLLVLVVSCVLAAAVMVLTYVGVVKL
jgi:hypothetical protein